MQTTSAVGDTGERRKAWIATAPGRCVLCREPIDEGDVIIDCDAGWRRGTFEVKGKLHLRCKPLSLKGATIVSRTVRRLERQWGVR